jgi:hypothetical protein
MMVSKSINADLSHLATLIQLTVKHIKTNTNKSDEIKSEKVAMFLKT